MAYTKYDWSGTGKGAHIPVLDNYKIENIAYTSPTKANTSTQATSSFIGPQKQDDYDLNSLYKAYGGGSGSGGGGYSVMKADISGLLSAYEQQAESERKAAETKYNNTRQDLLTSLKRFQEENARNVQNQKTSYLSEQASLESAREQANRQNRISAAARGLGGSGLQQLAQLQNLIGQSEQISRSAGSNQEAMDKLATLLRNYEEDSDTKMNRNEQDWQETLNSIASNLAAQKAAAIAQNEQNYVNAVNAARAQAAASRGSSSASNASAKARVNALSGALSLLSSDVEDKIAQASSMPNWEKNQKYQTSNMNTIKNIIKNEAMDTLKAIQYDYALDSKNVNVARNNINSILNRYK
jgi:hypothetical protein